MNNPWKRGTWVRGKQRLSGLWVWTGSRFIISLDSVDHISRMRRRFFVYGDTPEWGGFKLEREEKDQ